MKERDHIQFYDTSALKETPGIRRRCRVDYVREALREKFPGEVFHVTSVSINETGRYMAKVHWLVKLLWNNGKVTGLPPYCEVVIEHCTGTEWENIIVWSPLAWNDRFAGTAGGGTCTGGVNQITQPNNGQRGWTLPFALINGFTAATSDAGNEKYGSNWAVDKNGKVVMERIENWRANATHNMTVFGKAVAEILHKRPVRYSYMNGGSGGGRQSMVEAQEFPEDYDGIWASCPAINWTKFLIAGFWPMAAANEHHAPLKYHKLNAFAKAVQESAGGAEKYYRLNHRVEFDPFTRGKENKAGHYHTGGRRRGEGHVGRPSPEKRRTALVRLPSWFSALVCRPAYFFNLLHSSFSEGKALRLVQHLRALGLERSQSGFSQYDKSGV